MIYIITATNESQEKTRLAGAADSMEKASAIARTWADKYQDKHQGAPVDLARGAYSFTSTRGVVFSLRVEMLPLNAVAAKTTVYD